MKNKLLLWLVMLLPKFFIGQSDSLFQMLNLSYCTSGILMDKIANPIKIPDNNRFTKSISEAWWNQLRRATLESTTPLFADQTETLAALESYGVENQVLPIALSDVAYHRVSPDVMANGLITFDGNYFVAADPNQNIFKKQRVSFALSPVQYLHKYHYDFELISQQSVTNLDGWPSYIEIDADDGLGWRGVNWDQPFEISYNEIDTDKEVIFRWYSSGEVITTTMILKSVACESDYDDPIVDVPWSGDIQARNENESWRIGAQGPHNYVYGNAYYLPTGEFDKPFVFVEGIDFDRTQGPTQNGSFGWCQFTCGNSNPEFEYSFISEMPRLLDQLRERGYDIILLDFEDGAYYLEDNAQLLIHLINLINQHKQGSFETVLAGASMGGVISRYALAYMEEHGMKHCVRTYVSLDAPHQGAYVPVALQHMLHILSHESAALDFINNNLERPAAAEMLLAQAHSYLQVQGIFSDPVHVDWQNQLESLGFPQKCRSIGVANGNFHGIPNNPLAYEPLMDQSCELTPCDVGAEVKFYMTTSAGNPYYSYLGDMSDATQYVSAQQIRSTDVTLSQSADFIFYGLLTWAAAMVCEVNKTVNTCYVPANSPSYDYASGGTRNSVHEFANSVNSSNSLTDGGCEHLHNYVMDHAFVLTNSALNLKVPTPETPASSWIAAHPEQLVFDAIYAPEETNERHSSVNIINRKFIFDQVVGGEDDFGNNLIPEIFSNETSAYPKFNFGKSTFNYFTNTTIENEKSIYINKFDHLHYGNENLPEEGSHFVCHLRGNCGSNTVVVNAGGLLAVGDELEQTTAELQLHAGSTLTVRQAGKLYIQSGSKLVIKAGATLHLEDGAKVVVNDDMNSITSIVVEPGGTLLIGNTAVILRGDKSRIELCGGEVAVVEGATAYVEPEGSAGGMVVCKEYTHSSLYIPAASKLYINGSNNGDPLWHMQLHSEVSVAGNGGQLRIASGRLIFNSHSMLSTNQNTLVINCAIVRECGNSESTSVSSTQASFRYSNCKIYGVKFLGQQSTFSAFRSYFMGLPNIIELNSSSYDVRDCTFENASIRSEASTERNYLYTTVFSASNNNDFSLDYVYDSGLNEVEVQKCDFLSGHTGFTKKNGEAYIRCSNFLNNIMGLQLSYRAKGFLSAGESGGYNSFVENRTHIRLELASYLNMMNGFNSFSPAAEACISGTLFGVCSANCGPALLTTSRNVWPYGLTPGSGPGNGLDYFPEQMNISISNVPPSGCSGCEAKVSDLNPLLVVKDCPASPIFQDPHLPKMLSEDGITVFPNPASSTLTVSLGLEWQEEVSLKLITLSGQEVLTAAFFDEPSPTVDVSSLPNGYYLLLVTGPSGTKQFPVVVNH